MFGVFFGYKAQGGNIWKKLHIVILVPCHQGALGLQERPQTMALNSFTRDRLACQVLELKSLLESKGTLDYTRAKCKDPLSRAAAECER